MQYLLSLPENLVRDFHAVADKDPEHWFVASDPEAAKIGSGGGTAYLLEQQWKNKPNHIRFADFLNADKRIMIHAGGQSRRLPAYAPSGKILTPIPVFRWSRGQRLNQTLLDLQLPLYEKLMKATSKQQNTLIASGDVLVYTPEVPMDLPDVDVLCLGIWADPNLASRHGVFFTPRSNPQQLDFMLQKPSHEKIEELSASHLFMMDVGIWVLSDRAIERLMMKSGWKGAAFEKGVPDFFDLYSTFGICLGKQPANHDGDISPLTSAIVPLDKGEFYHYGTSLELITSTEKIQNRVQDQRSIWHHRVKPHPSVFVQNAQAEVSWNEQKHHVWIENAHIPDTWELTNHHVLTGIPENNWDLQLAPHMCLDMVPVGDAYCVRPYGMNDVFSGRLDDNDTCWMGQPFNSWLKGRNLSMVECGFDKDGDIQKAKLFPLLKPDDTLTVLKWMYDGNGEDTAKDMWLSAERLSAEKISARGSLDKLIAQRNKYHLKNLELLASNYKKSVFYQSDLRQVAADFVKGDLDLPAMLSESESPMLRFRDQMFRSEVLKGKQQDGAEEERKAFSILQNTIVESCELNAVPRLNVYADQIVWGRSPARLDLAGGWADTPPYCMQNGGSVVNLAVDLNGQPPLQVFIRLSSEPKIILRSIDNGVHEVISSYEEIRAFDQVGSAFCIPRAALCLAGFYPDFSGVSYTSLEEQLKDFGGGFEISLLAAIPKGSGLGTSSILAGTILGTLSDFCQLNWSHQEICHRTLILEQLLTTGGGWQDQYGGILSGIKLLESEPGTQEKLNVSWLPDELFTSSEYKDNWLLYYTGITRVAKNILTDIVRGMFLNEAERLQIVDEIKQHAYRTAGAIQRADYDLTGRMVGHSWELNKALDAGTCPPSVQTVVSMINDYALGYKLLGAGGGGYLLIAAKDAMAASRIQQVLNTNPPNKSARFVKMDVSRSGLQVSRS
jgi:galactokinase/mevalonate kinase-like predicted kinase